MIYYTADPHFGHEAIIKFQNRPFNSVHHMNTTLISCWNSRVTNKDTIYIIGDMFHKCDNPESILQRLNGNKILIIGNHDNGWLRIGSYEKYFKDITEYKEITDDNNQIVMCHYPLLTWDKENRSYMIHGHIHANTDLDFWPLIKTRERMLNAGVELNGYMPVTLKELITNNKRFKKTH